MNSSKSIMCNLPIMNIPTSNGCKYRENRNNDTIASSFIKIFERYRLIIDIIFKIKM